MAGFRDSKVPLRPHFLRPVGVLALSGSSPEIVARRVREFAGAGGCDAGPETPADRDTIDLTWRESGDLLAAFDAIEQVRLVLLEFSRAMRPFEMARIMSRPPRRLTPAERERLGKLTRSAWHLYSTLSASALDQCGFERVFGLSYGRLGAKIVQAIDVLEWAEAQHG